MWSVTSYNGSCAAKGLAIDRWEPPASYRGSAGSLSIVKALEGPAGPGPPSSDYMKAVPDLASRRGSAVGRLHTLGTGFGSVLPLIARPPGF